MTKIIVLDSAKTDFQEIQAGFKKTHSAARLEEFKQSFKDLFAQIKQFPLAGVVPDECVALELVIRQRITEGTRVIYEVRDDTIFIRMFLSTERDFMTHLVERMLRA
ncbi:type II toxin-antitoxin system RelE/ParE family toxin [Duganella sp. CF458]|uniref:type II toxin-antitoxin system RelE/ParE family toxin n=1 Tax=Duganella sp. CF458 TaxID=1884368 RepID=UPI000B835386|nr:type II toxin-antitoxin system RelE/ParE family toxin [Duganella sp. CF458]